MTPEDIRFKLDLIAACHRDYEKAHGAEDTMLWEFVDWCSQCSHPEIQLVAAEILKSRDLDFARHCA